MNDAHISFETFVDGVSTGAKTGYCSLAQLQEIPASLCFSNSTSAFPVMPPGSHTVKFVINLLDAHIGNNFLTKTMVRP